METATGFDLEAAIQQWRTHLGLLVPEGQKTVIELESHLRDAIEELRQKGLTPEESFLLATRRLGSTTALGQEFRKANPAAVWRQRVFWMVAGCLVVRLWGLVSSQVIWVLASRVGNESGMFPWIYTVVFLLLSLIPFALFWHLARSSRFQLPQAIRALWGAPLRFFGWLGLAAVALFVLGETLSLTLGRWTLGQTLSNAARIGFVGSLLPSLVLAGFLAWLMPRKTVEPIRS